MSGPTTSDQIVWKKVYASKTKMMNVEQIQKSLPDARPQDLKNALTTLVSAKWMTTQKIKDVIHFTAIEPKNPNLKGAPMTTEQLIIYKWVIGQGNTGATMGRIRTALKDHLNVTVVRKGLADLEKQGQLQIVKPVNAPTQVVYLGAKIKPAAELLGGVWYDNNKEFDEGLVDQVRKILLEQVRQKTFIGYGKPLLQSSSNGATTHSIWPSAYTSRLPTPYILWKYLISIRVFSVKFQIKNIMEIMRSLEFDGLVEIIKPAQGIAAPEEDEEMESGKGKKKGKGKGKDKDKGDEEDDWMDEEHKEILREKDEDKKKQRAKERVRKRKEKEKERRKEERKRDKRKEKKRSAKGDKNDRKKKRRKIDSSDDDGDEDEMNGNAGSDVDSLVDVNDLESSPKNGKHRKDRKRPTSNSKSKRKKSSKRHHSSSGSSESSSDSSESEASSSASSSSGSDSDDNSSDDSNDSASSIDSDDIDLTSFPIHRNPNAQAVQSIELGIQDLSDSQIVYRATNRLDISLGQTEVSCGKCPVFSFCEEGGPVNAGECSYLEDWMKGVKGGWVGRGDEDEVKEER